GRSTPGVGAGTLRGGALSGGLHPPDVRSLLVKPTLPGHEEGVSGTPDDEPELLLAPRDGVPPVTQEAEGLADVIAAFSVGTGPIAVDAERASGYRYSQRAYLVQLRRAGAGSAL